MDLQQIIQEATDLETQALTDQPKYEQLLKEICERDPVNSHFVTQYADLLAWKRKPTSPNAEDVEKGKTGELDEAQKVFERSLRYNSANVALWQSYL